MNNQFGAATCGSTGGNVNNYARSQLMSELLIMLRSIVVRENVWFKVVRITLLTRFFDYYQTKLRYE